MNPDPKPRILRVANALGMGVTMGRTDFGYWTGKNAVWSETMDSYQYVHEMSHFILSSKRRRKLRNFGLGDSTKGWKVSLMLAFWEEQLATELDRSLRAFFEKDPFSARRRATERELNHALRDMKVIYKTTNMPNWPGIFARCGKEYNPCFLK